MSTQAEYPLVITMWETYGSNMQAVAKGVADQLGLKLHQQAYSSEAIEEAQEQREKEGTLGMFFRSLNPFSDSVTGDPTLTVAAAQSTFSEMAEENTAVVRDEAAQGGVLLGRNGAYLLSRRPNTLHVKLDGPVGARVARAAELDGIPADRAAKRQVIEDDFRSQLSIKTYNFDPRTNDFYDLVINGAGMSTDQAVNLIVTAVRGMKA